MPRKYIKKGLRRKHGLCGTPEYQAWRSMNTRCKSKTIARAHRYSGRRITVCERWSNLNKDGFINFLTDLGKKPSPKHSVDRIDNEGNYEPGNVRWAIAVVQANNTSRNVRVTYNGKTRTLSEWARITGIKSITIARRLKRGWSITDALTLPSNRENRPNNRQIAYAGKCMTLGAWARHTGINDETIRRRLAAGWSIKDTLTLAANFKVELNNVPLTCDGQTRLLDEWVQTTGISRKVIRTRLEKGWTQQEALSIKLEPGRTRNSKLYTFDRKTLTVAEWAHETGIDRTTLKARFKAGWTTERTLTTRPDERLTKT